MYIFGVPPPMPTIRSKEAKCQGRFALLLCTLTMGMAVNMLLTARIPMSIFTDEDWEVELQNLVTIQPYTFSLYKPICGKGRHQVNRHTCHCCCPVPQGTWSTQVVCVLSLPPWKAL